MLVLSRKPGERILIGDDIAITVVKLSNGGVRLGIDAPHELPIIREELKNSVNDDIGKLKKPRSHSSARDSR